MKTTSRVSKATSAFHASGNWRGLIFQTATSLFISAVLAGCSMLNVIEGPNDFCNFTTSRLGPGIDDAITREVMREPPNGAIGQSYSRAVWDDYWNDRIYYVWDVGPGSCNGTFKGPSGPFLVRYALQKRRVAGLPEITLNDRNLEKDLQYRESDAMY